MPSPLSFWNTRQSVCVCQVHWSLNAVLQLFIRPIGAALSDKYGRKYFIVLNRLSMSESAAVLGRTRWYIAMGDRSNL